MNNNINDKQTLAQHIDRYLVNMEVLNKATATIETTRFKFGKFLDWCEMRSIEGADEVTLQKLQSFQKYLARYKKPRDGEKIIVATQHSILSTLKRFFNWMRRQGHLAVDPAENIDLPTMAAKTLPNKGLSPEEVERLFKSPNVSTKLGLRDRAMLAVFYSTGIRREELTILNVEDIDLKARTLNVMIPTGVERVGILGKDTCEWLQKYLDDSRPELDRGDAGKALFLNKNGDRMSAKGLSHTMKRILEKAGVHKSGSTHLWRHTFCTKLMGDNCNPLVAQKLMGHQNMDYLMRYTDLDYKDLIEAHDKHHPAA